MKTTRKVKLHTQHKSNRSNSEFTAIPWLNLSGLWLEKAGFKAGSPIEIEIQEKQLTIKAL